MCGCAWELLGTCGPPYDEREAGLQGVQLGNIEARKPILTVGCHPEAGQCSMAKRAGDISVVHTTCHVHDDACSATQARQPNSHLLHWTLARPHRRCTTQGARPSQEPARMRLYWAPPEKQQNGPVHLAGWQLAPTNHEPCGARRSLRPARVIHASRHMCGRGRLAVNQNCQPCPQPSMSL